VHYFAKLELPGSKTKTATCFGFISSLFRLLFLWFFLFVCFSLLLVFVFFFQFVWAWSRILRFWKRFNSPSPLLPSPCATQCASLCFLSLFSLFFFSGVSASSSSPFPSVLFSFLFSHPVFFFCCLLAFSSPFFSPLLDPSSGFYSQRMQKFSGNKVKASVHGGVRHAPWLKRLHYRC